MTIYAEDINYWQTGKSQPDTWIIDAKRLIGQLGGRVLAEAYGQTGNNSGAYMLSFEIQGERYKIVWPVLPSKTKNEKAARIQAATMLYHDIKAKCISATVIGVKAAFFGYYQLPDGRTMIELTAPELEDQFPLLLKDGE